MTVTMNDLFPLIGKDIEFLPDVVEYEGYHEVGMRATVVEVVWYDDSDPEDPVFQLKLSFEGHDERNAAFEVNCSFYDKNGTPCLSAREAGEYETATEFFIGNTWKTLLKLVDDRDAKLLKLYQDGNHSRPYIVWLEDIAKETMEI